MLRLYIPPLICLLVIFASFQAVTYNEKHLSPQGCKMSWMSPSYVLQSNFNASWTPLAKRYTLWLYREVGWENENTLHGSPVLFIPGNAGSSRQVRSIASSAIRQIYTNPYVSSSEFANGTIAPVDVFAAEFNEDLSAFHGPTLLSQKAYIDSAIDYILSLYPATSKPSQVLLIGHSMGGLVALSLLSPPSSAARISAVITMSSPNSLPPARFDRRVEDLYGQVYRGLYPPDRNNSPPVLAICGGATDSLIPSETCFLPSPPDEYSMGSLYRQTVFTTALEGVWTGVGHNEMVWCHQVRSKVARTAIEMAAAVTSPSSFEAERKRILEGWSRGHVWPPGVSNDRWLRFNKLAPSRTREPYAVAIVPSSEQGPREESITSHMHMLPFSSATAPHHLQLLIARGSLLESKTLIAGDRTSLRVKIFVCKFSSEFQQTACKYVSPEHVTIQSLPIPLPNIPFPQPGEGSSPEDLGLAVEVRELFAPTSEDSEGEVGWVGLEVDGYVQKGKRGLVAVLEPSDTGRKTALTEEVKVKMAGIREIEVGGVSRITPFFSSLSIDLSHRVPALRTDIVIPSASISSLVAYRVEGSFASDCQGSPSLIPPLLQHLSSSPESHFHALRPGQHFLLHGHASGPFLHATPSSYHGLHLRLYSSQESCPVQSLRITVDWWSTLGRIALRYWSMVEVWGVGVVAAGFSYALWQWENHLPLPDPKEVYAKIFSRSTRVPIQASGVLFVLALLPLPRQALIGTNGEWVLDPLLAVVLLWTAVGFVGVFILMLDGITWTLSLLARLSKLLLSERLAIAQTVGTRPLSKKRSFVALGLVLLLVATVIPHQVAFVISWLMVLWTSASKSKPAASANEFAATPPNRQDSSSRDTLEPPIPLSSIRAASPSPTRRRSSPEPGMPKSSPAAVAASSPPMGDGLPPSGLSNDYTLVQHVLLLQAFLLPTQAPVLAVWIRTLVTAGFTTPFDGDHNIFLAVFWLTLAEAVVNGANWQRKGSMRLKTVAPALAALLSSYSFLFGLRYPFGVFELANVLAAWLAISCFAWK
ncbi:GPI inositol deacylase [Tulasnella sp. 424]|nr:GPI inositol deacylase [Tulasnella sp. 424]KAG8975932.1 GPI inositol deacylase [Tulasnella sp. 425]